MAATQCPKCHAVLREVGFIDVTVLRCTACEGIWLNPEDWKRLRRMPGAQAIDAGSPEVGARHNTQHEVNCPECNVLMLRLSHLHQSHLWYEQCGVCGGVWLDAGEFRDSCDETLLDKIRDWMTPERS